MTVNALPKTVINPPPSTIEVNSKRTTAAPVTSKTKNSRR